MRSRARLITCLQIVSLLSAAGAISWVALVDPGRPVIERVALTWTDGNHTFEEEGHLSSLFDPNAFGENVSLRVEVTVRHADYKRGFEDLLVVPERWLMEEASYYAPGPPYPVELKPGGEVAVWYLMTVPKNSIGRIRDTFRSRGIGHLIVARFLIPDSIVLRVEKGFWNPVMNFLGLRRIWIQMQ